MIKLGYHPATWLRNGHTESFHRALDEMSLVGWDGFEFAGPLLERYYCRVDELKELLAMHRLELCTYYHACSYIYPERVEAEIESARRKADFLRDMGAAILLIDGGAKREGGATEGDLRAVADAANRIGEMAKARGLQAAWHQHWGTMFEYQDAFERLMETTDPDLVAFCPDTAQLSLGDFDLGHIFTKYIGRIKYVHFKDLDRNRRFIELGKGVIDFPPLLNILKQAHYDGWIVVDLDYTSLDPRESCAMNLMYLREMLQIEGTAGRSPW